MSRRRILAGMIIVAVGVVFVGVGMANRLFSVGPAFDDLTEDFRPQMTDQNIATLRQDIAGMAAVSEEFSTKVVPTISQALGMTPEQFSAFMGQEFPAVAQGVRALPQIGPRFGTVVDTLDEEQGRFASADAIPTTSLPAKTVPWTILFAGIAAIIVGALTLRPGVVVPTLAIALGILLIAGPIFMSLPRKASDADTLNEHLTPVYTAALVTEAQGGLATIEAMGTQMQTEMLPALAEQLQMTPEQLDAFLGQEFPALAATMASLPDALGRFTTTVGVFDANLENFDTLKPVAFEPIVWTLIAGGALLVLFGAISLTGAAATHAPVLRIRHREAA